MTKGWLDNFGKEDNYNDSQTTAPQGFEGDGYSNVGRNYSPAWGGQFQMGGSVYPVNYVPKAQNGSIWLTQTLNHSTPVTDKKSLNIKDKRNKLLTTNQPLRPNSDLVNGEYNLSDLNSLMEEAKRNKMSKKDMENLAAISFQETKWGETDDNIGHLKGRWGSDNINQALINAYTSKMKDADRLGIQDPYLRLQRYNV